MEFDIIPKTIEDYISVTFGCIRFIDSYRFLSSSLGSLVKTLDNDDFKTLKEEFPDKWEYLIEKLAYPYEFFNSIDGYQKPVNNLKKENFFSKLKIDYPIDSEIEKTKKLLKYLIFKMEKI